MSDLAKRAVACKGWRWMDGMALLAGDYSPGIVGAETSVGRITYTQASGFEYMHHGVWPDLDDPATRGCLLALVRQAYGNPSIYAYRIGSEGWCVPTPRPWFGATEAAALVAALEAAPEKHKEE